MSPLSRRTFLAATLATGILSTLPASRSLASEAKKRLVAGTRTLEVNGRAARVYSLIGPDGRPGIRLRPRERFRVDLANQSGKQTLVHWHGQLPPWTQDGFPWPETPPLADGAVQSYDYTPIPGTYWMHSHYGMQEQVLMTAPLIFELRDLPPDEEYVIITPVLSRHCTSEECKHDREGFRLCSVETPLRLSMKARSAGNRRYNLESIDGNNSRLQAP